MSTTLNLHKKVEAVKTLETDKKYHNTVPIEKITRHQQQPLSCNRIHVPSVSRLTPTASIQFHLAKIKYPPSSWKKYFQKQNWEQLARIAFTAASLAQMKTELYIYIFHIKAILKSCIKKMHRIGTAETHLRRWNSPILLL